MMPGGINDMVICIGTANDIPEGVVIESDTFCLFIDPNATAPATPTSGSIQAEYGDFLHPPSSGQSTQDHPYLIMTRQKRCSWYGNVKLFDTCFDLMVAAAFYSEGNTFTLVELTKAGKYVIAAEDPGYHPMSGKIPLHPRDCDVSTLLALYASVFFYAHEYQRAGFLEGKTRIYPHLYSVYSVNTMAPALLISYYKIYMNGDGTIADKFYSYAEYRATIAHRMIDLAESLCRDIGTTQSDPASRVGSLFSIFGMSPCTFTPCVN